MLLGDLADLRRGAVLLRHLGDGPGVHLRQNRDLELLRLLRRLLEVRRQREHLPRLEHEVADPREHDAAPEELQALEQLGAPEQLHRGRSRSLFAAGLAAKEEEEQRREAPEPRKVEPRQHRQRRLQLRLDRTVHVLRHVSQCHGGPAGFSEAVRQSVEAAPIRCEERLEVHVCRAVMEGPAGLSEHPEGLLVRVEVQSQARP
mmetsp:Transcript_32954/g.78210  ORF Transcript_32954/g.78210 Transcript_32954/m.78210 type:complete len:203 (-) Transcript_32954:821-1429(-)